VNQQHKEFLDKKKEEAVEYLTDVAKVIYFHVFAERAEEVGVIKALEEARHEMKKFVFNEMNKAYSDPKYQKLYAEIHDQELVDEQKEKIYEEAYKEVDVFVELAKDVHYQVESNRNETVH
jgi:hypothetical protein